MSIALRVAVGVALLAGCSAPETPPPGPPDCTQGCGVGVACTTGTDCLFGSCTAGVCAAPTGASPTGPVTATITPAGATLQVVSNEGVSLSLAFPAGAVSSPLEVTLTPQAPGTGWIRVGVSPSGVILDKPATVTVTLPAGTTHTDDASLMLANTVDFQLVPSTSGTTITGNLQSLGVPALAGDPASRPKLLLPSLPGFLAALPIPLRAKVDLANLLLDAMIATARYRDALELQGTIASILLRSGEPQFDTIAGGFLRRAGTTACTALTAELVTLQAATPKCAAEHQHVSRPVMNWAMVVERLGSTCPAMDGYVAAVGSAASRAIAAIEADATVSIRCDCKWTPEPRWSRTQQLVCPGLRPFVIPLALAGTEWAVFSEAIAQSYENVELSVLAGDDAAATVETEQLARPFLQLARKAAWEVCRRDHDQTRLGVLLASVPNASAADRAMLTADAHACAVDVDWEAFAATSTTADENGSLAPTTMGVAAPEASVPVNADGRVRLSGTLPALHCPAPATVESDAIVVKVVSATGKVEVARQLASGSGNLLGTPLDLDVASLYAAVTQDPVLHPSLEVEASRASPGCNGLYGTADVKLFKLVLGRAGGKIAFVRGDLNVGSALFVINADGTGLREVRRFPGDDQPGAAPSWAPDARRLAIDRYYLDNLHDVSGLTLVTLATGAVQILAQPPPARGGDGDREPHWSPDGTRIMFKRVAGPESKQSGLVVDLATGQETVLLPPATFGKDTLCDWSPDSQSILFTRPYPSGYPGLYVMKSDGTNVTSLGAAAQVCARWSPDGKMMAYSGFPGTPDGEQLHVANADGTNPKVIHTSASGMDVLDPSWSPDSQRLVFNAYASNNQGPNAIFVINADGTGLTDLTHGVQDSRPSWSR